MKEGIQAGNTLDDTGSGRREDLDKDSKVDKNIEIFNLETCAFDDVEGIEAVS